MFKDLAYKHKFYALIAFTGLFALLVYQNAISKTVACYKENKLLDAKIAVANNAPVQLQALTQHLTALDGVVQLHRADTIENVHAMLLTFLSSYAKEKGVILKNFPDTRAEQQGEFEVQTHVFSVEGRFTKLLQMVYLLEQKDHIGKVCSLNFVSGKDAESKRTILTSTVYLQNIKRTK